MEQKYCVGDVVQVLEYDEIAEQFIEGTCMLPSECCFPSAMKAYCGKKMIVEFVETAILSLSEDPIRYMFRESGGYRFTHEMLKIPDSDDIDFDFQITFDDIMN
jgi:hypothetical protein